MTSLVCNTIAVEVYLSTGRNTYPIIGIVVIGLLVPIYVGFIILNCYLYHKKQSSEKKEAHKHRPSIAELLPSQQDACNGTYVKGHANRMTFELNTDDSIASEEPVFVTPL